MKFTCGLNIEKIDFLKTKIYLFFHMRERGDPSPAISRLFLSFSFSVQVASNLLPNLQMK